MWTSQIEESWRAVIIRALSPNLSEYCGANRGRSQVPSSLKGHKIEPR